MKASRGDRMIEPVCCTKTTLRNSKDSRDDWGCTEIPVFGGHATWRHIILPCKPWHRKRNWPQTCSWDHHCTTQKTADSRLGCTETPVLGRHATWRHSILPGKPWHRKRNWLQAYSRDPAGQAMLSAMGACYGPLDPAIALQLSTCCCLVGCREAATTHGMLLRQPELSRFLY